jgi:hypothetical protein
MAVRKERHPNGFIRIEGKKVFHIRENDLNNFPEIIFD